VLLLDNSAWARIVAGGLGEQLDAKVAAWIQARELATCLPFRLEAGYSARSKADHAQMMERLDYLLQVEITGSVEMRAARAQGELATIGHHRLPPIDVMIAACAHEVGGGVLHYDGDYDVLAQRAGLTFESVWLAPPGSL
jgi:predicted nucleic acid-binding protein